ncbi:D-glycero-beta-D-manno-heptose 1,7-bisphosphate 7-phosphatase [Arcobacter sp. FWKO B]|uniref:D-glycero-beta-D-manno-heptose 1,7-bisphosphate 7-phosphatase n=1 Tax=Arcobacter sp. FWKO B TaxID=2593672 RepID=UPI0018A4B459|nr:D-glycero-beta-D-manno-heptose 1,7-bisphosphate 7-phosphatase [Arcobacter sp. FWKO B]QOG11745.1 D-glycero-beta-D-manno-heptose 1,7-bisphosphate 7-phosphatase [Arcobacter sp. FWKO B]
MNKAVFIDRDGVINIEKDYVYKIKDFEFIDGVFEACSYLQKLGYVLIVITNQSGIGRGYYTQNDFETLTYWMLNEFEKNGITITKVYHCPHAPKEECRCRKPKTGMIDEAVEELDIDVTKSYLIGDKISDIECAKNAKIKTSIHVKSGHSFDEKDSNADFIIDSIKEIKNIIKQ